MSDKVTYQSGTPEQVALDLAKLCIYHADDTVRGKDEVIEIYKECLKATYRTHGK